MTKQNRLSASFAHSQLAADYQQLFTCSRVIIDCRFSLWCAENVHVIAVHIGASSYIITWQKIFWITSPVRVQASKNMPNLFPGQMSLKMTKPESVCPVLSQFSFMHVLCFCCSRFKFVFGVLCLGCSAIVSTSASDWLERLVSEMICYVLMGC